MKHKVMYVCYSNKGRSVALAAYTNHFLQKEKVEGVIADSSGIGIENIESLRKRGIAHASRNTETILKHNGTDISAHRLRYFGEVVNGSSLILVADEHTLERTINDFPQHKEKCFLAKQYAGFSKSLDILGPYADTRRLRNPKWTELMGYEHMLREIRVVSRRIVRRLKKDFK